MAAEDTLQYTKFDFQSHKSALIQRVRSRYPKLWNDFLSNSLGTLLIDIVAYSTATVAFMVNRLAGENFVSTMTTREAAVRIGSLVGYQLRGPIPSTVLCEASLATAAASDVTISKGTIIRVGDTSMPFEVKQDYTISAGNTTPQESVAVFSAALSGSGTISSDITVTGGSKNVDVVDTSVDLTQYLEVGQVFRLLPSVASERVYTIESIEAAPGAVSNNRIVITPAWNGQATTDTVSDGVQQTTQAEVYDRRIAFIQGQTLTDNFVSPDVETADYAVKLTRTPAIQGSVEVTVNGRQWEEVESVATSNVDAEVYQVKTLSTGQTVVKFGDGTFGKIVPTNATVVVTYRVGGGSQGNIEAGSVSASLNARSDTGFVSVTLANDTAAGQGGRDAETVDEARINIPYHARTNDRAVTIDDFQTLAQNFNHPQHGSVAYARAIVRTNNSFLEGNIVTVYAWTVGSSGSLVNLQPQLKQALQDYLDERKLGTDYVLLANGTTKPAPISLRFKVSGGFDVVAVRTVVTNTVDTFVANLRPGSPLVYSDLLRKVDEVYGVDSVNMATPTADLVPDNPTELLTRPDDAYVFTLARTAGALTDEYTAAMPAAPLAAWSFRMYLGTTELSVVPHTTAGFARLLGGALSTSQVSTVNLLTGAVRFFTSSSDVLTTTLNPVGGYDRERDVDLYIGYDGDNTQAKRREIRAALRSWSNQLTVGAPLYGSLVSGVTASTSNVTDVVEAVSGVTSVNRVALSSPASNDDRVVAQSFELLKVGQVILNNNSD